MTERKTDVLNDPLWWKQGAARVLNRCDQLARCSDSSTNLTRTFLSPSMNDAHELVAGWMREAAMMPHVDEMGNLLGYMASSSGVSSKTWLLGSHLDTVPNAGKYDGALGVLLAIETVSLLRDHVLPFALQVIGFSEEEGVRFKTPYLGSRAIAGTFDPQLFELCDANGISMGQALRHFGLVAEDWEEARYYSSAVAGYLEAHIEQGPMLESLGAPLGIVTDIVGQSRLQVRFSGQSGHAGTLPMHLRRDALAAASEWVLVVEAMAGAKEGLVATVGSLDVRPNTPNVVAGEAICSVDVRHASDAVRETAVEELLLAARDLSTRRGVKFEVLGRSSQKAVPMDTSLRTRMQSACDELGVRAPAMVSGAGHDAAIMATLCPCAMLFLRTPGGASHCPEEAVNLDDVALALQAMHSFLVSLTNPIGELNESPTF